MGVSGERTLLDVVVKALEPYDIPTGRGWSESERLEPAQAVLDAIYGVEPTDYEALHARQQGKCACCGNGPPFAGRF